MEGLGMWGLDERFGSVWEGVGRYSCPWTRGR